jgi:predicted Fe-S protein YdhL (DUF1289 family)
VTIHDLRRAPDSYDRGTHSPCIGVCFLDPEFGTCQGCGRTGDEISGWATASRDSQAAAWDAMPNRLQRSSRNSDTLQLRPWAPAGILQWVEDTGVLGAESVWAVGPIAAPALDCAPTVTRDADVLTVQTGAVAFRLTAHDKLRAFAFGPALAPTLTILTLPKGRVTLPVHDEPILIGPDTAAVSAVDRGSSLLDLGLTSGGMRLALRGKAAVLAGLPMTSGTATLEAAASSGAPVMLIAETQCARLEQPLTPELCVAAKAHHAANPAPLSNLPGWAAVMAVHTAAPRETAA